MAKSIPQEEWDFSNCSTDEAHECLAWELARESELVITDVKTLRKGVKGEAFEAYLDHIGMSIFTGMDGRAMNSFYFCPEFPEQPYLSVPDKERKQRLTKLWGVESDGMAAMIDAHKQPRVPYNIRHLIVHAGKAREDREPISRIGGVELAMLNINWHCTDNMLTSFFQAWLIKNRPTKIAQQKQGHGVPTTQAKYQLKALGALRLLRVMDYAYAVAFTEEATGIPLYKQQGEWTKANKKAAKLLASLEVWEKKRTAP